MRHKILMTAAAAFVLSSVGMAAGVAVAQVTPAQMKADGEKKDPAAADAAIAKDEADAAKKLADTAKKKADVAQDAAKSAADSAADASKDATKDAAKAADNGAKDTAAPH